METLFLDRVGEIKKELNFLEKTLKVKLKINGKKIEIEGSPLEEYEAIIILKAISFGFSAKKSILLKDEQFSFQIIGIKDFTKRKNLAEVRARLIGKKGQTKKTIEEISGCHIVIRDNEVGIIGYAEDMQYATTAMQNLIKGAKQANVYKYLERINASNKQRPKA